MTVKAPKNYLNNKDLLLEIHRSKSSFCSFTDKSFHQYDIILPSVDKINIRTIADAKRSRAKRLLDLEIAARKEAGDKTKPAECEFQYKKIPKTDLIFRIMTYDHIPLNNLRKKTPKSVADRHEKVNFKPFQHWKFDENDNLVCVGKSHWKGDLTNGHFDVNAGKMTDTLAKMLLMMCERYATRGNVRLYSYNDEMRGQAILQLVSIGLQFDESKSDNPFSYLTSCVTNSFLRVINIEKRHREIRDDILEMNGLNPSFGRTTAGEYEASEKRYTDDHD
jgi:hypothetical protein